MSTHRDGEGPVLSSAQSALLKDVLDRIVPRHGELPGAGELGVAEHIDSVAGGSPQLRRQFSEGLAAVEIGAHKTFSQEFSALTEQQKARVLRDVEAEHQAFFETLVRHTYAGYYVNPTVIGLLGLEARAPQPQGYKLEPFDVQLLDRVKERGEIYRRAC